MRHGTYLLLLGVALMTDLTAQNLAPGTATPEAMATAEFNGMVDKYFDEYFHFHPSQGTAAGFHQYDNELEDYSQKSRDAELSFLLEQKQGAGYAQGEFLNQEQRIDLKLISNAINSRILELQEIRMWQKNPNLYSARATSSIFELMSRNFAPPAERLKSVIAREQKIPANLVSARANLKDPPQVYTEIAIRQLPGIIGFFQKDVPEAFKDVTDPQLLMQFKASNEKVIAELQRYQDFLKNDLLPVSKGDYRLGPELYRKKLLYDDMVEIPLDRLLQVGYDDLHKNQAELKRVAAQIDPSKTPEQVLAMLEEDHPKPDQLLQSFRGTFDSLIGFIQDKKIITIYDPETKGFKDISFEIVEQKTGVAKDNPLVEGKKLPAVDKEKKTVTIYSGRQKLYAVITLPDEYLDRPPSTWDAGDEVRIYYKEPGKALRLMNISKTDIFKK